MTNFYFEVFYPKQVRTLRCASEFTSFFKNGTSDHKILTKDGNYVGRLVGALSSIIIIESLDVENSTKTVSIDDLVCEDCKLPFKECKRLEVA
jgi:hypothetical protein